MNRVYRIYILLLLLLLSVKAGAQNMALNCSFEQHSSCPTGISLMNYCVGWKSYHLGTSDYFHPCAPKSSKVSIPENFMGWQRPVRDTAYAGVVTYSGTADYKEYIVDTITPLTVDMPYEVSMYISLGDSAMYATNDLGVWFFKGGPTSLSAGYGYLHVTPHVSYKPYGAVRDTMNWVRVTGTFYADSAYSHMVIGGFDNPAVIWASHVGYYAPQGFGYYYIDSVEVKQVNISCVYTDTSFCQHDSIKVPYKANAYAYYSDNVFTLQLSDATGSFAIPAIIATDTGHLSGVLKGVVPSGTPTGFNYHLRIVSSHIVDSSIESAPISIGGLRPARPEGTTNFPICETSVLKLYATDSTAGVTYKWSGPGSFWSDSQNVTRNPVFVPDGGRYIVTAWLNGCSSSDTVNVSVTSSAGYLYASVNGPICEYDTIKLHGTIQVPGVTDVKWVLGRNTFGTALDTTIVHPGAGTYVFALTGIMSQCPVRAETQVLVKPVPHNFKIKSNTPVCEGDSLYIYAPVTLNFLTFAWKGPSGFTSTNSILTFDPSTLNRTGRYTVIGAVNGCYAWDTMDVVVKPAIGLIQNNLNAPVCEGDTLKLYGAALAPNNLGFLWVGPNGFFSAAKDTFIANVKASMSGAYKLFGNFDNCSSSDTVNVLIKPTPVPFDALYNGPVCLGDSLKLTTNADTTVESFTWQGPRSFFSASRDTAVTHASFGAAGDYILTGYYNGCSIADTLSVRIKPLPDSVIANASTPVCEGDVLKLYGNTISAGAGFSWQGPDNFSAVTQYPTIPNITQNNAGNYIVTATVEGCIATDTVAVTVKSIPQKPDATANGPLKGGDILMLHVANKQTDINYSWVGPEGFRSSLTDPVLNKIEVNNAGIYIVTATQDGCTSSDSVVVLIDALKDTSYFVVYPNASNGNFTITGTTARDQDVPVRITASNGQLVYEAVYTTQNMLLKADLTLKDRLSSGVYTLRVKMDGEMHSVRLLVVRNP